MPAVMRFVTCTDTSCPMNESKQCRAPRITVNAEGVCMLREAGPFDGKAQTERYVEIYECRCQKCNSWEQDPVTEAGVCGLGEDLSFLQHMGEPLNPKCSSFEKQIGAPPYTSKM